MHLSIAVGLCIAAAAVVPLAASSPSTQEPFISNVGLSDANNAVFTAKITDHRGFGLNHMVDIEVGTPPQSFRASIDIAWTDAFLPSSTCKSGCPIHPPYTSSESSTYVEIGDPVDMNYFDLHTEGHSSQDTFRVAGLEIKSQVFEEQTRFLELSSWNYNRFDTSLGLSPLPLRSPSSNLKAVSVWHSIVKQKLLQRNMFSLKLSKLPHQDGEIMFGGSNPNLFEGELMSIPLTHVTFDMPIMGILSPVFENGWQVAVKSLSMDPMEIDLTGYVAIFMTAFPAVSIPYDLATELWKLLKSKVKIGDWGIFDCDERKNLPNLKVRLGVDGSVPLTISPWHYVSEIPGDPGNDDFACFLPFDGDRNLADNIPKHIILGSAFLRGVYSVFDQDEETISFAQLKGDGHV